MSSPPTIANEEVSQLKATPDHENAATPSNDLMGTDMVILRVGTSKTPFVVHKTRLIRRIPYFETMFNGHFKETVDQEASFPEDDAATFDILIEWVYNFNFRKVREMVPVKSAASEVVPSWDAISFYSLAEKFMLPNLQDIIISHLHRYQKAQNELPSLPFIRRVYDTTTEDSKLRLYSSYALYYIMKQTDRNEGTWPMAEITAIIQECDGACKDFLALTMKEGVTDPRNLGACIFHKHPAMDCCSVTGKRYGGGRGSGVVEIAAAEVVADGGNGLDAKRRKLESGA